MAEGKVHQSASEKLAMPFNVIKDADGSSRVILMEPTGTTAEVLLQGGRIISWKNARREEMLFVNNKVHKKTGKVMRGGVYVGFPQTSNMGSADPTGFVRKRLWSLDSSPSPLPPAANPQLTVDLVLKSTDDDMKSWPHRFELRLRVALTSGKLTLTPRVRNVDSKPFSFTFALCTYLSVSDISEVRVEGLETLDYFDNLKQKVRCTEQADAVTFDGEVERIYLSTPPKIAVIDHEKKRTLVVRKEGMPDAVLWNPWDKKAKAMADFGDGDYRRMLCLDSASIETPVSLKPGEEWRGRLELTPVSSSYCSGQLDPQKVLQG